ncbi:MAG: hypothetical protein A3H72_01350 [Candidatus Doudnabacteria bacterium RIFCSPLOWO2_02_FULL_48_8]|uniref:HTH arsR-type domain-containing protein n=1 Tax=Candidatus Doudnabacteria bacterium RIFCSPHIGHO2_01_FULL_46_24 TaxID=1817825 RepID=A0A1F5NU98_9BACT|nr:MAG: hypothetical protein A2720_01735 [Candidatus Doudnabacteria bacterium RIFCSPHIGHO2_01_FULL_46_24]OGE95175.1 MAG: hypothetical protein A3H72_01350 [Candidatus Doudnabacteria bacterium RIFCSPLOWO2_02_FULL_48_8]OGE95706.1 MAG: hypothetical protein A3E98_02195 [Candidatus Doudnabacteria bacterium RIFCSPHIGHO2_12_FULL_48_11]
MLTHLLSSKPKSKLVNLLLTHPGRSFSLTELRLSTGCRGKLLVSTVRELTRVDFVYASERAHHRYYQINRHFALYPELVSMLRKVKHSPHDLLALKLAAVRECRFAALSGVFIGRPRMETDILLVGKVRPAQLSRLLKFATRLAEGEINYTIFDTNEFEYRKIMNDRFVKNVLENNPVIVVDKTKNRSIARLVYKL